MNRVSVVTVVITVGALTVAASLLLKPEPKISAPVVTNISPSTPSNSSPVRFTSSQPDKVSTGFSAVDDCANYTLTAELVRTDFLNELKARAEWSGINTPGWDPVKLAQHTENAKRIIEQARRCRRYSDDELGLTKYDLESVGLEPVPPKKGKP